MPDETTSPEGVVQLPDMLDEALTSEGAAQPEGGDDQKGKPAEDTTPTPRTYSEDEWRKAQSTRDKEIAAVKKEFEEERQRYGGELQRREQAYAQAVQAQQQEQIQRWLKHVEERGGDVDMAKQQLQQRQELENYQSAIVSQAQQLEQVKREVDKKLKLTAANELAREYSVDVADLMDANTPSEMEAKALKLHIEKKEAEAKPQTKVDSSRPSTKGVDFSKMTIDERMAWALEHE